MYMASLSVKSSIRSGRIRKETCQTQKLEFSLCSKNLKKCILRSGIVINLGNTVPIKGS